MMVIPSSISQKLSTIQDSIESYFEEIKLNTNTYKDMWGVNLYGPILLVDPKSRKLFSNTSDTMGVLKQNDKIYTGYLPSEINIANTAIEWSGKRWAMIILPLPMVKQDRINLLSHELFHVKQPSLGFKLFNSENIHLDQKDGRIYLRLELEALKKCIKSTNKAESNTHLSNAITFRKYRYSLYPVADSTENLLELNEGIAEYTGSTISGRNKNQLVKHFLNRIDAFLNNATFVRSFAYETIPIYGYLLGKTKKNWHRDISTQTNLTDYFISSFNLSKTTELFGMTDSLMNKYNGEAIISEEIAREQKTKKLIANYTCKFVTNPHLELEFEQMNVSFDPGNIMPLDDQGMVYPNMRITDNWGILTVKNGALMSPNWDKISVSIPTNKDDKNISGDGWILELKDGYKLTKNNVTGIYQLVKL